MSNYQLNSAVQKVERGEKINVPTYLKSIKDFVIGEINQYFSRLPQYKNDYFHNPSFFVQKHFDKIIEIYSLEDLREFTKHLQLFDRYIENGNISILYFLETEGLERVIKILGEDLTPGDYNRIQILYQEQIKQIEANKQLKKPVIKKIKTTSKKVTLSSSEKKQVELEANKLAQKLLLDYELDLLEQNQDRINRMVEKRYQQLKREFVRKNDLPFE